MDIVNIEKINISGSEIMLHSGQGVFKLVESQVKRIKVGRAKLSFFDEIGIWIEAQEYFFIEEIIEGFLEIAERLSLERRFGVDWYFRAERGEVFEELIM